MDHADALDVTAAVKRHVANASAPNVVPYQTAIDLIADLSAFGWHIENPAKLVETHSVTHPGPLLTQPDLTK